MISSKNTNNVNELEAIIQKQRNFFATHTTFSIDFRIEQLKKLKKELKSHQTEIFTALKEDLGKSMTETFMSELFNVYNEINFMLRNIKKLSKKRSSLPAFYLLSAKTYTQPSPYGCALIISPWNYPLFLTLKPLVGAIACGNCVLLKTSELAPKTSAVLKKIISNIYNEEYIYIAEGGVEVAQALLKEKFDFIFYTGSTRVGKIVMEAASKYLTPLCLELGGKSPVIVLEDAKLEIAAKRIIFGKYFNAGQTCIAPDYIIVQKSVKNKLVQHLNEAITQTLGSNPLDNTEYTSIINDKAFERLIELAGNTKPLADKAKRKISITLIDNPPLDSPIMQEEIFGPLLPIIEVEDYNEAYQYISNNDKPLAAYLFTENKEIQENFSLYLSGGGLCVNDTLMHVMAKNLPFGGIGMSGMGQYVGKASFDLFSHNKPVLEQSTKFDISLRYPPFPKILTTIIKKLSHKKQ